MTTTPPPDSHDRTSITRRKALAAGAGLTTATSLTGCLGVFPGGGTPTPTASVPEFAHWAYPQVDADVDGYSLRRYDLATMRDKDAPRDSVLQYAKGLMEDIVYLDGVATMEDVDALLEIQESYVFEGPWKKAAMEDAVSAFSNIQKTGSRSGYTLYDDTENAAAFAIRDGVFVAAHKSPLGRATDVRDALVAAKTGEGDRFAETSSAFGTVASRTGGGYFSSPSVHEPWSETIITSGHVKGVTAEGVNLSVADGKVKRHAVFLFAEDAEPSETSIERLATDYYTLKDPTVTQETDRIYAITGVLDR
jgi:hypothetical protein